MRAERHDLGDDDDQQRALGVGGLGDRLQIADRAEDVRVLDDDAAGLVVDGGDDVLRAERIGRAVRIDRRAAAISRSVSVTAR